MRYNGNVCHLVSTVSPEGGMMYIVLRDTYRVS